MFAKIAPLIGLVAVVCAAAGEPERSGPAIPEIPAGLSQHLRELVVETTANNPNRRAKAADELGEMGERAAPAVPFLLRLLTDGDLARGMPRKDDDYPYVFSVGIYAHSALHKIGAPAMEGALRALRDAGDRQKQELISLLGTYDDRRAAEAIVPFLKDSRAQLRKAAANALSHGLQAWLLPVMTDALTNGDSEVRYCAASYFGRLGAPGSPEVLIAALNEERDHSVRFSIMHSLAELRSPTTMPVLLKAVANNREDRHVRLVAALALGRLGDRGAAPTLVEVLNNTITDDKVREGAATALGMLRDPRAEVSLTKVANDPQSPLELRESAVEAIGVIQGRGCVATLLRIVRDEHSEAALRGLAAFLLIRMVDGTVDDTAVVTAMKHKFRLPSTTYEPSCDIMSGVLSNEGVIDELKKVVKNGTNEEVRAAARAVMREREEY
jgi:HEAT repeat protein